MNWEDIEGAVRLRNQISALKDKLAAALKERDEARAERELSRDRLVIGLIKLRDELVAENRRLRAALEPTEDNVDWLNAEVERGPMVTSEGFARMLLAAIRARAGLEPPQT